MARKYHQGKFVPTNKDKYIGKYPITYRSSWEFDVMSYIDKHPNVAKWSSESITIPYRNPYTRKWTVYIPDFFIVYIDKDNNYHAEMWEIKPQKEDFRFEGSVNRKTKLTQGLNYAKWTAAVAYCARRNWVFKVLNETDLYQFRKK